MKTSKSLWICLLTVVCWIGTSCNDKDNDKERYPITTTLGVRTCTGMIAMVPMPHTDPDTPVIPGMLLGLETTSGEYILSYGSHWITNETLTVDDVVYAVDDKVKITGTVSITRVSFTERYTELEIETIENQINFR